MEDQQRGAEADQSADVAMNAMGAMASANDPAARLERAARLRSAADLQEALAADPELPTLVDRFRHHAPTSREQVERYERIRAECRMLAETVVETAPHSDDRTTALKKIEEAMFWANAAIARHGS